MTSDHTADHTAIVTGANHGIGAATAEALARRGCAVLCSYLRVADPEDPGIPRTFRDNRARDAAAVIVKQRALEQVASSRIVAVVLPKAANDARHKQDMAIAA